MPSEPLSGGLSETPFGGVRVVPGGLVTWSASTRSAGDFGIDAEPHELSLRRLAFVGQDWVWLRQVHGADVIRVDCSSAGAVRGAEADAMVTTDMGLVLSVQSADCAPVIFTSEQGVIAAAHAGWRGIEAGVVQATTAVMASLGATAIEASIGPCIGPECYEFGVDDLDRLAARFGPGVRSSTSAGRPALDVVAAVRAAAAEAGVEAVSSMKVESAVHAPDASTACTACNPRLWFSHRARSETSRMATVIWLSPRPE